ncbi:DJ-1/PfpI family protein [Streptomyces sp. DSM 15324]|uniref:DJ-1/PfpI family protein n=1 Tax=Streptomyces sp. DSM 15324 TaxID=1739111 RepID=UPI0007485547|nr:DJ-1/PfpI family protein [Streptomyces sp. DSM 15324]KUO11009.1 thiamine biosynthesis protein ThiJ [Streptomyces sp. DSM 15324]
MSLTSAAQPTPRTQPSQPTRTIAFVAYPGLTLLDLVGPLQVFSALQSVRDGFRVVVVGERLRVMGTDTPLDVVPDSTFDYTIDPYAVVVPGGPVSTLSAMADQRLLDGIRRVAANAEVVGSVCTGSLLLGAAGLLDGRRATTHWMFRDLLTAFGATPVAERWVEDGPYLTAAGVSAGIDMALHLVSRMTDEQTAREIQLLIEYDPQPPFGGIDWGTVDIESHAPIAQQFLTEALTGHPDLLALLRG